MKCLLDKPQACFNCPYSDCIDGESETTEKEKQITKTAEEMLISDKNQKRRERIRKYNQAHKKEILAYLKKYREKHRKELNEYRSRYYYAHREEELERQRKYDKKRRSTNG